MDLNHEEYDTEAAPMVFASDLDETPENPRVELEEVSHIRR